MSVVTKSHLEELLTVGTELELVAEKKAKRYETNAFNTGHGKSYNAMHKWENAVELIKYGMQYARDSYRESDEYKKSNPARVSYLEG